MRVRRLLALLLMFTMTIVSGTSLAAAMCGHQNATAHAEALHGGDALDAATARLEDSAAAAVSKQGVGVDAGTFSIPAFILPAPTSPDAFASPTLVRPRSPDAGKTPRVSIPPPLKPPAA